ncbi:unnamed protein product [Echinostoma caproni]|uniref:Trafficking protein particle complex subunit 2 n=1 Tax=Echinostoma caproni TaxID=27848 RepID=A0A183ACF7_9TREM|nr:unnamed protein product [Echinostoma caproni]
MVGRYYFVIVGHNDEALFEFDYSSMGKSNEKAEEYRYLNQYVAHAALDVIDDQMWLTTNTFLKTVDKFNEWIVSAFVTPGTKTKFSRLYSRQVRIVERCVLTPTFQRKQLLYSWI